ncbi:MFS transporter [Thermomonospora cellulosilytica]|uniref:MFS family permease n=1 Tax=Thermomonospora cellulosilytica TaxID=1411118 RepID=A0A7W3N2B1_9ACTN|nr:MFS transporter [Thermomonospora cellulosilytica]MBA9006221.1 MFS family permease [Thermomonospora cellulosilytica]
MATVLPPPVRTAGARRAALALPGAATLLALMNYCAPMTTLSATAAGLGAGEAARIWLLGGINLGLTATLLVAGSLADDHGRRRVFALGAVALALASALCAAAPNAAVFVAGRIAQGAASAALLAAGLGILGHAFPGGAERTRATGVWGAMLSAGIALGPIAASLPVQTVGWRSWYWLAAVLAVPLALGARLVPESRAGRRRGLDLPGALTLTAGVTALMTALTLGRGGWDGPHVIGLLIVAAVLLAAFTAVELRRREPMVDLRLLRHRGFAAASLGALMTGIAVIGMFSYLSSVLERTLGLTPLGASVLFVSWSGVAFAVALQAGRLPVRFTARHRLAVGMLLSGAGQAMMLGAGPGDTWWRLVPGLAVAGVGSGLANASLAALAVGSVPADRAAMGSGANNTARYAGAAIGVALVAAIAAAGAGHSASPEALAHGVDLALAVTAALSLATALAVAPARGSARQVLDEGR